MTEVSDNALVVDGELREICGETLARIGVRLNGLVTGLLNRGFSERQTYGYIVNTKQSLILGAFILVAAISHALLGAERPQPLHVGVVSGDIEVRRDPTSVVHLKCDGCKIECYESFVMVYVDKEKAPTWNANFVKTIPWSKIEYLTLAPPELGW